MLARMTVDGSSWGVPGLRPGAAVLSTILSSAAGRTEDTRTKYPLEKKACSARIASGSVAMVMVMVVLLRASGLAALTGNAEHMFSCLSHALH
jgi:hypothetical protein